jgi:uncharacterized membrane protein
MDHEAKKLSHPEEEIAAILPPNLPRRRSGILASYINHETETSSWIASSDTHVAALASTFPLHTTITPTETASSSIYMTREQLDDILRFEERLRYSYIILKRIQFKYVILLLILVAWVLLSIVKMYLTGSKWHAGFFYVSCTSMVLFFLMGLYRKKITRPAR